MEYLDNQKGTTDTSHIGTRTFGNSLYSNNTINSTKNQIALLSSQNNMQQIDNNIPIVRKNKVNLSNVDSKSNISKCKITIR